MFSIIKLVFSPLISLFIFVLGNGLFNTLLTIRLHLAGNSTLIIGAMAGAYYAGLACASFKMEPFIIRVGHIRAFSAFASALAIISLLHGLFLAPWFWLALRFLGGFATAGLFIVIESWLLILGTDQTRGQVLALYMVTFYAAQASGQLLINVGNLNTLILFAITSILCSLSVIPLAMTKIGAPQFAEPSTLNIKKLYKVSSSGVVGCFCAGLIVGAIYGLLPLYISTQITDQSAIGFFMALTIFGGMTLQYPLGKLSDLIDRRRVLLNISLLTILTSILMIVIFHCSWAAIVVTFIFGGLTFTLYPISISLACDSLTSNDMISGTQGLLLAYSIGATIGPLLAPIFTNMFGMQGLFIYFIVISTILSAFFYRRHISTAPVPQEDSFVSLPQTTPITAELDPRTPE